MISAVVYACLMLGLTMAPALEAAEGPSRDRRDITRDFAIQIQEALNKGKFSNCANKCAKENIVAKACPSICAQNQFQFKQLTAAAQKCLLQPLCNIDLRNVPLPSISIPIQNENFNGRCVLQGDATASISFGNYSDAISLVPNLKSQPTYLDDVTIYINWNNFKVYCVPCYPPSTGTGFSPFDFFTCVGTTITKVVGVDLFKCPADKLGGFSGNVEISQKIVPRYLYVFIPPRTNTGANRETTYSFGQGLSEVNVLNVDSTIPTNNVTDITTGIKNALTSQLVLNTFTKYYTEVYNSIYSFHVAARCPKCPVTPLPQP